MINLIAHIKAAWITRKCDTITRPWLYEEMKKAIIKDGLLSDSWKYV